MENRSKMATQIREAPPHIYTQGAASAGGLQGTLLFFRFPPGTGAQQIQTSSWPCRKIVYFAPGLLADAPNALSIYAGTQGVSAQGRSSMEIPPGGAGVIETDDIVNIFFVAQNATDIITGYAEARGVGPYLGQILQL